MHEEFNTEEGNGDDDDDEEEDEDWDWDDEVGRLTMRHNAAGGCNPQVCWRLFGEHQEYSQVNGDNLKALFFISIMLSVNANFFLREKFPLSLFLCCDKCVCTL